MDFSAKEISIYQQKNNIEFYPRRDNVLDFYRNPDKYRKIFKKQDLIYSIGLADYIPDLIFGGIVKFCFSFLKKNGSLVIAHKNVKTHKSLASDWFCNWHFYPRSEEDVEKIIVEHLKGDKFTLKIDREKTEHIFFLSIHKA